VITPEQIADLRAGDVVELTFQQEYDETPIAMRGTFPAILDFYKGYLGSDEVTLTVVSRAPRPFYVNHPRADRHDGDVAIPASDRQVGEVYASWPSGWLVPGQAEPIHPDQLTVRLRLLIDGETGEVVQ
jgi:hypothetical protein